MTEQIEALLKSHGFDHFGWTGLEKPLSLSIYKQWIDEGLHGEMEYLRRHLADKENPSNLLARASSAIVVTRSYLPHPRPHAPLKAAPVALYARGEDYHRWFREELESVARELKSLFPSEAFLTATDSMPVLERDLAYRAGLGWIGKNTCLIHEKRGSLFFIGEILTTLQLTASLEPQPDRCGTCTRCLDACPTGALVAPRKLDARKCISYTTIESKSPPEPGLRELNSSFYYGCDICQTVCPWNVKAHGAALAPSTPASRDEILADLRLVLRSSGNQLEKLFLGTPLRRASPRHHKTNAIVLAANLGLAELTEEIKTAAEQYPQLAELGAWALQKISRAPTS
ncbi:MAG TPA: tRNA epoxyqueuosine(34) reductase QueG [Bdellovibrionales bacterium]|nr:tRNA epoxyqueuosine(34) reductase QueG [Bdellovibrionales bacterium]